tara:strand:- start:1602 stop:2108 length:507 start_codon:yes stop_codon:yes gene_type:complete
MPKKDKRIEVVTVDFDDTLKMTEAGNPNPIVINKINKLRNKVDKIYIVTSRRNSWDNRLEINEFIDENNLEIDGIHLTNFADKWYTLEKLGSDLHFDDDDEEWRTIAEHLPEIKLMKVDHSTGKILKDLDEVYSDKQRRWACSQVDNSSSLTKKQAKEMCKGPTLKKK